MATFTQAFVDAHQAKLAAKNKTKPKPAFADGGVRPATKAEAAAMTKEREKWKATPNPLAKVKRQRNGYNTAVVLAYFKEMGLPEPVPEYQFAKEAMGRDWRFDFCWNEMWKVTGHFGVKTKCMTYPLLALECQGGIFSGGRHVRGAALLKEWEKLNAAAELGFRVIYCQPSEVCMLETVNLIKRCLGI